MRSVIFYILIGCLLTASVAGGHSPQYRKFIFVDDDNGCGVDDDNGCGVVVVDDDDDDDDDDSDS